MALWTGAATAAAYIAMLEVVLACHIHIAKVPAGLMQQADATKRQAPQMARAQQHAVS